MSEIDALLRAARAAAHVKRRPDERTAPLRSPRSRRREWRRPRATRCKRDGFKRLVRLSAG